MAESIVTCDLQMERETLHFFFAYLISALSFRPLRHGRHQADNSFPPISAAACHDRFLRWQRWFVFVFLWGYVKNFVFLPSLLQDRPEQRKRIIAATASIDRYMLQRVRAEMDCRLEVCPSVGRRLHSFPPFNCADFVKCNSKLWITL
jgi:hypothetical protein